MLLAGFFYVYVVDESVVEGELGEGGGQLGPAQLVLAMQLQRGSLAHPDELPPEPLHVQGPPARCNGQGKQRGWRQGDSQQVNTVNRETVNRETVNRGTVNRET